MNAEPEYRSRVLGVLALCIGTGPGFYQYRLDGRRVADCTALAIMAIEGLFLIACLVGCNDAQQT